MKRLTKELREEAAMLCSAAASAATDVGAPNGPLWVHSVPLTLDRYVRELELDPDAGDIADEAHAVAFGALLSTDEHVVLRHRRAWAEAHAMLETGWTPAGWTAEVSAEQREAWRSLAQQGIDVSRDAVPALVDEIEALLRYLDRWRHGRTIEGDDVCPYELEVVELRAANEALGIHAADWESLAREHRAALLDVIASAVPNERDHPAMSAAWKRAESVLNGKESSNG